MLYAVQPLAFVLGGGWGVELLAALYGGHCKPWMGSPRGDGAPSRALMQKMVGGCWSGWGLMSRASQPSCAAPPWLHAAVARPKSSSALSEPVKRSSKYSDNPQSAAELAEKQRRERKYFKEKKRRGRRQAERGV